MGGASLTIPATDPEIGMYVKDPLRGVLYDQALPSSVSLAGQEVTLRAVPYYFANESISNGSVSYVWALNGNTVTGPNSAQGELTLRQTQGGQGSAPGLSFDAKQRRR